MNRFRELGFSLVEAVVALVILSGAAVAVLGWADNAFRQSERIQDRDEINLAAANFLAELDTMSLSTANRGRFDYGEYSVLWSSKIIDSSRGILTNGVPSKWIVALFHVDIEVTRDSEKLAAFTTRKATYRSAGDEGSGN